MFSPAVFAAAGQHGVERRDAKGRVARPDIDRELLFPTRKALAELQSYHKGLLVEDKGTGLAMHYRLAPNLGPWVQEVMTTLVVSLAGRFMLENWEQGRATPNAQAALLIRTVQ